MEVGKVTIINKGIKYECIFFEGPGNGLTLLEMPDHKRLQP